MMASSTDTKIVYIRFHKSIDALLTEFSRKTGMKRATAAVWIRRRYIEKLLARVPSIADVTREHLGLLGEEEAYFIALGRSSSGSALGRGMQLTVEKAEERTMQLLAMQVELSERDLHTVMLVQYFREIGMLEG